MRCLWLTSPFLHLCVALTGCDHSSQPRVDTVVGNPPPQAPLLPPKEPEGIEIMSYNLSRGLRDQDLIAVRQLISGRSPDVVCLQEAKWPKKKSIKVMDQVQYLADTHGYECRRAERGRLEFESYGMAVLVRGHIEHEHILKVPHERPYGLVCVASINGQRIAVVSVHMRSIAQGPRARGYAMTEHIRREQADDLCTYLSKIDLPIIIAGDFNTVSLSPTYGIIAERYLDSASGSNAFKHTRMTEGFPLRIDYIFLSRDFTAHSYDVLDVKYSDHRPVLVSAQRRQSGRTKSDSTSGLQSPPMNLEAH